MELGLSQDKHALVISSGYTSPCMADLVLLQPKFGYDFIGASFSNSQGQPRVPPTVCVGGGGGGGEKKDDLLVPKGIII